MFPSVTGSKAFHAGYPGRTDRGISHDGDGEFMQAEKTGTHSLDSFYPAC